MRVAELYKSLQEKADEWALDHLKGKELSFYLYLPPFRHETYGHKKISFRYEKRLDHDIHLLFRN